MTEDMWKCLSRRQQLRLLHEMRKATAGAFNLTNIQIERMLHGLWAGVDTMRKFPRP